MNVLKDIKSKLYKVELTSLWNRDFYSHREIGVTPVNSEYCKDYPFRILYDGTFQENGFQLEITVGISSNEYGYYEFYVEDYLGGSECESHSNFNAALKSFIKTTNIRNPIIYTDDDKGNAIRTYQKVRPSATVLAE